MLIYEHILHESLLEIFTPAKTVASWQQVAEVSYLLDKEVPFKVKPPKSEVS